MASPTPPPSLLTTILFPLLANWPILLPLTLLLYSLHTRYATPLRKYPGPILASFSRLPTTLSVASTQSHYHHIALHQQYGPIVRIAPNELSISSPEAARQLLSAGKRFYKTDFYSVFPPPENPDIFTEVDEAVHARKKRVANGAYGMGSLQKLGGFVDDVVDVLVGKLGAFAHASQEKGSTPAGGAAVAVDLGNWLHWFAFDVLGEVAFSRSFGFLAEGRDVENAISVIDASQRYNGIVGQIPWVDSLLRRNPIWKYVPGLGMDTKDAPITRLALAEMGRRMPFGKKGGQGGGDGDGEGKLRSGDGRQDLMASLIQGHLKDPEVFGEGDVFAVAHGAIFAGSDSTASTMQSFFHLVLSSPRISTFLTKEIATATSSGTIPSIGNLSWTEAQSLPYFQACLKEAMRLRPAVGLNITRLVPPGGAEIEGEWLPGGTRIAVNGWVLHRDRGIFGEDCEVFRPERWIEDAEKGRRMERYMFQFGGGAHLCIGRNLALLEINKVVPRLLRDFDFELVHPGRPLKEKATFFVVQEGLVVYIRHKKVV